MHQINDNNVIVLQVGNANLKAMSSYSHATSHTR